MERRSVAVAICLVLSVGLALAQAPAEMPKPGPEHEKLAYFVGTWTSQGELLENPFMPAGKFNGKDTFEWFEGKFAIVGRSEGTGPMGPTKWIGIMGYSTEEKVYTYYGVDNSPMAMTTVSRGTVKGDTWVFEDESKMGGQMVKSRYTMKILSPTSYTFEWAMEKDGSWNTLMKGKNTKSP